MTVFIRNKRNGKVTRYPLIGNVSVANGRISITKDPRCTHIVTYDMTTENYEVIRVTAGEMETPEAVRTWAKDMPHVDHYIETVFG